MSVEIFDVDTMGECSNICSLGNGVWLQRKDLELILSDFCRIKEWAEHRLPTVEANDIISRIKYILKELPFQWSENSHITQLWMG